MSHVCDLSVLVLLAILEDTQSINPEDRGCQDDAVTRTASWIVRGRSSAGIAVDRARACLRL
jgi:hypothetical protein